MASPSDRESLNPSASGEPLNAQISTEMLEQGLLALKQKHYIEAIAYLKTVEQSADNSAERLKAQMGLVKAYARDGQIEAAIAQCEHLQQNESAKIQAWAQQARADLEQKYVHRPNARSVPQAADAQTVPSRSGEPNTPAADHTGFVPFNAAPARSNPSGLASFDRSTSTRPPSKREPTAVTPPSDTLDAAHVGDTFRAVQPSELEVSTLSESAETHQGQGVQNVATPASVPAEDKTDAIAASEGTDAAQVAPIAETPYQPTWRQAGRAAQWKPLGQVKLMQLWITQAVTVILLVWLIRVGLQWLMSLVNGILARINWPISLSPISLFYRDPIWVVVGVCAIAFALLPWIGDEILRRFYSQERLDIEELSTYSPESVRLLRRVCNQQGWPVPQLRLLPAAAPLAFTYGCLPRFARITVSRGLLEQLAEDEVATLYARELSHISRRDFAVLSWLTLLAQIPYLIYWQVAHWGDRQIPILKGLAALISALGYGLYWVIRWIGLWLSRLRTYYGDRASVELTGNPNGLVRALLKIALGTATEVQRQGYTSYELESLDVLTPLGHRHAIQLGSLYAHTPIEPVLQRDYLNPYRFWLAINSSHPPIGERFYLLTRYAQYWRLEPELDLPVSATAKTPPKTFREWLRDWQPFLFQASPWVGLAAGLAIALLFWLIGEIMFRLGWWRLSWLAGDLSLLKGCIFLGFGLGVWLRINTSFPDLSPGVLCDQPDVPQLLKDVDALPIDPVPVRIQGQLLGRKGVSNWLCQDLLLQTQQGLIKLHRWSALGPLGNLILQSSQGRPDTFVGRQVRIVGWFRRGINSWIDLELLRTERGQVNQANPAIAITLLGSLGIVWGLYLLYRGG